MVQIALPIAPIVLMPFIVLFFIIVFPIWLVGIAVLGLLMWITRGTDWLLRQANPTLGHPLSGPVSNAFHWTLSWGGLARRRDQPPKVATSDVAADVPPISPPVNPLNRVPP